MRRVLHFFDYKSCKSGEIATSLDHVKPLALGGENKVTNLQVLTVNENKAKGNEEIDYRKGRICPEDYSYETDEMESEEDNYKSDEVMSTLYEGNNLETVDLVPNTRRAGGGRKPKEATILRRRIIEDKAEEAEASFSYIVAVRDNPYEPSAQRLAAAGMILDRVLGKATEHSSQERKIIIQVIRENTESNSIDSFARLALSTGTD